MTQLTMWFLWKQYISFSAVKKTLISFLSEKNPYFALIYIKATEEVFKNFKSFTRQICELLEPKLILKKINLQRWFAWFALWILMPMSKAYHNSKVCVIGRVYGCVFIKKVMMRKTKANYGRNEWKSCKNIQNIAK